MKKIGPYWKAIVAFVAPGCVLMIAGADDGWTTRELSVAALTCVVSAAAVYATPRKEGA